ncbi:hypothetical protein SDRG_07333 [Saprolegnia diclina VS20]|uniref:Uncharacterized protein n=1 Tax=Saprolegnia diclina (strain VS20) TaxID=1156394 RepID=T0QB40_SAPDV|nr:hypothetical protein SDRG_07333 [Saprolegnia diclina VS20]EQC35099.1 hypothetical protein SDRG_07333 [Saprolegnia diclina VS20]|eukprot:XP_008611383.1 hypothetical protein SDRG_07333 [Saprolegnia diclina VS20]
MATRSAYDDGPPERDNVRIERDVMSMLPFFEYLVDLPDVSRSVHYRPDFVDLLDEYAASRQTSPQFANWWSWLSDRDEGCRILLHRMNEMGLIDGDGSPSQPFKWNFSAMHRAIQARGKGLVLSAPLRYNDAINYDVVMYTKYAFSSLTKRQPYYVSKIESELRFRLPSYVDADAYIATLLQQMERHPEIELVSDHQGQMIFRLRSNGYVKPPLPFQAAAANYINEALDVLQRDDTYPITHMLEMVRNSRLEGCAQDAYIARVLERFRRDGRFQFVDGPTFERSYFTFARRQGFDAPPASSLLPTPKSDGGLRDRLPKGPLAVPNAVDDFSALALELLQYVPMFAISFLFEETKACVPPQWTHDRYLHQVVQRMKQNPQLHFEVDEKGRAYFTKAGNAAPRPALLDPPPKKIKRSMPTVNVSMAWAEPRLVLFPTEVTPRPMHLETDDCRLQVRRKALVEAGTPPNDGVEDGLRKQRVVPPRIPLDLANE